MPTPLAPPRGVVFDLNGTLVDDIPVHFRAWREVAVAYGVTPDDATLQTLNGLKNEDIVPRLLGRAVSAEEYERITHEKEETYRALYRPRMSPVKGARELIDRLRRAGVRLAMASSAPPANRDLVLDGLAWRPLFDVVVAAEHLPGKPAPDVFLEAARRLGLRAEECLVFEDAVNGIKAAVAAGMPVVALTTTVDATTLLAAGARHAAPDFDSFPDEVLGWLARVS